LLDAVIGAVHLTARLRLRQVAIRVAIAVEELWTEVGLVVVSAAALVAVDSFKTNITFSTSLKKKN